MTAFARRFTTALPHIQWQFSLATLLLAMVFVGLVSAALRDPNELWAGLVFVVGTGSLLVAALVGIYYQDGARAFAVGFLIFGGAYTFLSQGDAYETVVESNPELPTTRLGIALYQRLHQDVFLTTVTQTPLGQPLPLPAVAPAGGKAFYSSQAIAVTSTENSPIAAPPITPVAAPVVMNVLTQTIQRPSVSPGAFLGVVHRSLGMLFGLIGGILAQAMAARRDAVIVATAGGRQT